MKYLDGSVLHKTAMMDTKPCTIWPFMLHRHSGPLCASQFLGLTFLPSKYQLLKWYNYIKYFISREKEDTRADIFEKLNLVIAIDQNVYMLYAFSSMIWPLRLTRPCWSGFMQVFESTGIRENPGTPDINFMSMIYRSPSDLSCIYSTLSFVCDQPARYEVTPGPDFTKKLK